VREQVINQKVGNRSGIGGKGKGSAAAQRPVRRDRESGLSVAARLRNLVGYLPAALKIGLAVVIAVLIFLGYRAAAAASFFQVKSVETRGISRASNESVVAAVRHDVGETGVWRADLSALSGHLEQLPWVRTAIVTRVLPNGIRVRITERQPRLVVRTSAGRFVWVDEDAVVLSEMLPSDQTPNFFLRGWNEDQSQTARSENVERVKKFIELQSDWDSLGLSERVSEVNLGDTHDVRAQLAGDDSQIEVRLGAQELGPRLKKALGVLDSQRQTSRGPLISYIDLTQGKRAIVGLASGTHVTESAEQNGEASTEVNAVSPDESIRPDKPTDKNAKDSKTRNQIKKPDQKRT
jgi:cell division septal protein FtsQ